MIPVVAESDIESKDTVMADVADALSAISMDSPDRFINRELSWLAFNERVLEERPSSAARTAAVPVDFCVQPR